MTEILLHFNGRWHIGYLGLFTVMEDGKRQAPFPAYYDVSTKGMICLWGEEDISIKLVEPTASEMHQYEERQHRVLVYGIEEVAGTMTGRFEPKDKPPAKSIGLRAVADKIDKANRDAQQVALMWDVGKHGKPTPDKLDLSVMRSIYSKQRGISDDQLKLFMQLKWDQKDWGLMECDRCPGERSVYGNGEPCNTCPTWEARISVFRRKYKMKFDIGQNTEIPF